MSNYQKKHFLISVIVLLALSNLATVFCYTKMAREKANSSQKIHELSQNVDKVETKLRTVTDTVFRREILDSIMYVLTRHDTVTLKSTVDTVAKYLSFITLLKQGRAEVAISHDSLFAVKNLLLKERSVNKALIDKSKNLTVMVQSLDAALSDKGNEPNNADISIRAIKKKGRGVFSPQRNYFRITRTDTTLRVNGQPYYDASQTNDEINQLNFQGRAAYNFSTGNFSIGPGIELKVNRLGINAAWLFNPETFKGGLSLGTRFDVHRTRFK